MNTKSFGLIYEKGKETFHRFPYALIAAVLACGIAILMVEIDVEKPWLAKTMLSLLLGLPLFLILRLRAEVEGFQGTIKEKREIIIGWCLIALYAGTGYYDATANYYHRYAAITLTLHLALSFVPFWKQKDDTPLWQFNRKLFARICLSVLYALVFFIGVSIALWAIDHLLDIDIEGELYQDLWLFSVFVVQSWHFLSGVPKDIFGEEEEPSYPVGFRIFSQYLLIPLILVYSVILYIYMGKIVMNETWPKGQVSWLVSSIAVLGYFTVLIMRPASLSGEYPWIEKFKKIFFGGVIPLVVLMLVSVLKRVGQYGITERRYYLLALGCWAIAVSAFYLKSKKQNIKWVPISLAFVCLFSSFGPWSAFSVARNQQLVRLSASLEEGSMFKGGRIVRVSKPVEFQTNKDICSILDYLTEYHGVSSIRDLLSPEDFTAIRNKEKEPYGGTWGICYSNSSEIVAHFGLDYISPWTSNAMARLEYFYDLGLENGIRVEGYDHVLQFEVNSYENVYRTIGRGTVQLKFQSKGKKASQIVYLSNTDGDEMIFDLGELLKQVHADPPVGRGVTPSERLSIIKETYWAKAKVQMIKVEGELKDGKVKDFGGQGYLLWKRK